MKDLLVSTFLLLLISPVVFSQSDFRRTSIEDGWNGIRPLETTQLSVDKLLGIPEVDDNDYYGYLSDDAFVQVNYSTAPCQNNQYERGAYSISKGTVLDYNVTLKHPAKLSEIKFNREKYRKDTNGHLENSVLYVNEEDGIYIGVGIQENVEYIGTIKFRPGKKIAEKFKCEN